jgi:hypothetical protein
MISRRWFLGVGIAPILLSAAFLSRAEAAGSGLMDKFVKRQGEKQREKKERIEKEKAEREGPQKEEEKSDE